MPKGTTLAAAKRHQLKAMWATGDHTKKFLAEKYDVSVSTVNNIIGETGTKGKTKTKRMMRGRATRTDAVFAVPISAIFMHKNTACVDLLTIGKFLS